MNSESGCFNGQGRIRVAVFGSFYGGYHVLKELLGTPLSQHVNVVGVASDDPTQAFTHPGVRLWKYPHTSDEERMVPDFAALHGLPLWTGRVKDEEFTRQLFWDWAPDLCLMATFGQMIPRAIFSFPRLGFFNFHHSDSVWPSYPGPDPIAAMIRDGKTHAFLTMHEVSGVLDGGAFVAHSHPVPLAGIMNGAELHRRSWPQMAPFIRSQVLRLAGTDERLAESRFNAQAA
ncbi:MAG: formyltransferase family protein [Verrucomicrobiia bacterium]